MRFNTIGVSDGISMGTDGMSYSLQSRDLIADSIETVMCAQWYDACIVIPGCDKNMPGCAHGASAGSIARASWSTAARSAPATPPTGEPIDIVSAFTCYGAQHDGQDDRRRAPRGRPRTPAPARAPAAACTPPTRWPRRSRRWACRCPTARRSRPTDPGKLDECRRAGAAIRMCWRRTSSRATS